MTRILAVLLLGLVACGKTTLPGYVPDAGRLSASDRSVYVEAKSLAAAGRRDRAIARLGRLAGRAPGHVPTRLLLQDLLVERDGQQLVRASAQRSGATGWINRLLRARLEPDLESRRAAYRLLRDERPNEVWGQLAVADAAADAFIRVDAEIREADRRGTVEDRRLRAERESQREVALEEAAEAIENAVALDPTHVPALRRRGDVLGLRAGREPDAARRRKLDGNRLAAYDAALALAPEDLPTLVARAALYRARNDYVAAQRDLRRAIAIRPWDPDLHQNLGVVAYETGGLALAERSFRRALELEPRSPETLRNLGDTLAARESWSEARDMYERALGFAADDPSLLERLGNLELRTDHPEKAKAWYRRYLEVGGPNRTRVEASLRRAESRGSS